MKISIPTSKEKEEYLVDLLAKGKITFRGVKAPTPKKKSNTSKENKKQERHRRLQYYKDNGLTALGRVKKNTSIVW